MTDFGTDIATPGLLDIDPYFIEVSGVDALGQALGRRLVTPRGSLEGDPAYGYDLRTHLNDDSPDVGTIGAEVAAELLKDERVARARASATFDGSTLTVSVDALTALGPFRLTLDVSAVSTSLLFEAL